MGMYVLQVLTGSEMEIRDHLRAAGIEAHVPQEARTIRTGGRWIERLYTLFPSYVFVAIEADRLAQDYYRIRRITGVIRFLELRSGTAAALTAKEEAMIRSICADDRPAQISDVIWDGRRIVPLDGPLKDYSDAGYDIRYSRHHRKAKVYNIGSIHKELVLSFRYFNEPAGSPRLIRPGAASPADINQR